MTPKVGQQPVCGAQGPCARSTKPAVLLRLFDGHGLTVERAFLAMELDHSLLDRRCHLSKIRVVAANLIVVTVPERLPDHGSGLGVELTARLVEHEAHRSLVDRLALAVAEAHQLQIDLPTQRKVEHHLATVHQRRQHGVGNPAVDAAQKLVNPDAGVDAVDLSPVSDLYLVVVHAAPFRSRNTRPRSSFTSPQRSYRDPSCTMRRVSYTERSYRRPCHTEGWSNQSAIRGHGRFFSVPVPVPVPVPDPEMSG
jgi:hypothetical protein